MPQFLEKAVILNPEQEENTSLPKCVPPESTGEMFITTLFYGIPAIIGMSTRYAVWS